jgi:hypothetical protein
MQCKDIPDAPIMEFLANQGGIGCTWLVHDGEPPGARCVLGAMPAGTPPKLALAKMSMLIRRGVVSGCTCGCRGDFELTSMGRGFIKSLQPTTV